MDNNQKIEFLLKLQRRERRRRIIVFAILILLVGAGIVFSQLKNMG